MEWIVVSLSVIINFSSFTFNFLFLQVLKELLIIRNEIYIYNMKCKACNSWNSLFKICLILTRIAW